MQKNNTILFRWVLGIYSACLLFGIFFFTGTGDLGDSISHFLFAKYAPIHPELYFHHWAKPVFVLLASPFAQFGFIGLKFFNAILSVLSVYLSYRVADKLQLKHAWLAALLLACMPLNYVLSLSALTEPLFAFFTILSVYYCVSKKYITAAVLLSFLPYVRSEGLIVLGVFALYFILIKNYRTLGFLCVGSVLYGLAGYPVHGDVFWVFTKIPYAHLSSVYGKGTWYHFIEQLTNVVGIPIYGLLWLGVLYSTYMFIRGKFSSEKHILITALFLSFFIAHSLFWYLGIFNSMGLMRVFLGVAPVMALLALQGFNLIRDKFSATSAVGKWVSLALILYILVFPFTPNPSAIHFQKDLMAPQEQLLADKIASQTEKLRANKLPVVYNHYYMALALNNDRFSRQERIPLNSTELNKLPKGSVLIWDNVLYGWECDVDKSALDADTTLQPIVSYSANDFGRKIEYKVYVKK